jgi:hypothetical protein
VRHEGGQKMSILNYGKNEKRLLFKNKLADYFFGSGFYYPKK